MKGKTAFGTVVIFLLAMGCAELSLTKKPVPLNEVKGTPDHTPVYNYDGWVIARAVLHNHTTYSDGCRTPEDLVQLARNEGMAVLSINDHREGEMCSKNGTCFDAGGVDSKKVGYQKYYEHINRLSQESQSPIILFGIETVPYIWVERRFGTVLGSGANNHFTSYGIENPEIYANMPAQKVISLKPQKNPGIAPYEKFVDYIRDQGGEVFIAHADVADDSWRLTLHHKSPAPNFMIPQLIRLTGVALVPDAMEESAKPGGWWDQGQFQYLVGFRPEPLWGWGESDYHCDPPRLRYGITLFYLKDFSKDEVFNAMKSGRMVAVSGEPFMELYVAEFSIGDGKASSEKIMLGQKVRLSKVPVLRFSLSKEIPIKEIRLIKNGKVIYTTNKTNFEYRDESAVSDKMQSFYRVDVVGEGPRERLFTNPIFVFWK